MLLVIPQLSSAEEKDDADGGAVNESPLEKTVDDAVSQYEAYLKDK